MTTIARPPLLRPRVVLLGGVCAGVAAHLGRPTELVRAVFVVLALCGGAGVLLYLWCWAFVPVAPGPAGVRRQAPVATLLVLAAFAAAAIGVMLNATGWYWRGEPAPVVPGVLESAVLAVAAVVWSLAVDARDPGRSERSRIVLRAAAGIILVLEGVLLLGGQAQPARGIVAVGLVALGVIVLVIPRVVSLWTALLGERSARVREEQRAEIAAHLHDSVLQTLALIQNRAGPQSEVARLARAQERELRDWLFAGTDPFAGDLTSELRAAAAALELEYAVRIELVTVGDAAAMRDPALLGAAREAMLNAARHVGGEVSVYVEASPDAVSVFVRDRGPGFDADAIPDGRIGIRESIVGRMQRAGGTATVRSDEDGTEVQLELPRRTA